jgi:chromate reductase, NAD(P)H dehydrogenase (quinone)
MADGGWAVRMKILAISGSLRAKSSNTSALEAMRLIGAIAGVAVELFDGLADLPPFNPDLDTDEPPAIIEAFRAEIGRCDGLLISTPEYAHGMPGVLKNALDWLVGSLEFAGTPVALIHCSPLSIHVLPQLREVLRTMSAEIVEDASIILDLSGPGRSLDATGIVADPGLSDQLRSTLSRFVQAIEVARTAVD